jgi:dihydroneopterin aldolase
MTDRRADERGADERGADERGADERSADERGADDRGADDRTEVAELDLLTLTGLEVYAYHGVFDFERENGQLFVLDLEVSLDTSGAANDDDLGQTLHYGELAVEVSEAVAAEPVDLIETLAERVANLVLAHAVARSVRVTVHKPNAPITVPFGDVSITIRRSKRPTRREIAL